MQASARTICHSNTSVNFKTKMGEERSICNKQQFFLNKPLLYGEEKQGGNWHMPHRAAAVAGRTFLGILNEKGMHPSAV